MSKTCEVCNRPYSDDLTECPHCAAAVEVLDEDAIEIVEEAPESAVPLIGPDSAIDLGTPAPPSDSSSNQAGGSGLSVVEWASLVEEQPTRSEPAPLFFDNPSDANILRDTGAAPPAAGPSLAGPAARTEDEDALASDLDAVRNLFGGDASASFALHVPPTPPSTEDDSALNLLAPDADLAELPEAAQHDVGSGIDLGPADVVEESAPVSAHEAAADVSGSGIDLMGAELEQEVVDDAGGAPPAQPADVSGSGIDLMGAELEHEAVAASGGAPPATAGGPVGSDSGIDLDEIMDAEVPAEELDAVEVVDSGLALKEAPESAIDLSGVVIVDSGVNLAEAELTEEPASDPSGEQAAVRPVSDAGLDLSGEEQGTEIGPLAGIEKNTPDGSESGRDRIAEEVESGVNLSAEDFDIASLPSVEPGADSVDEIVVAESGTDLAAGQLPSEAEEVDLTEMSAAEVESSAVDLGASATFPVAPSEAPPAEAEVETAQSHTAKPRSIHGEEEITPSQVNLGGRHDRSDSGVGGDYFDESGGLGESALNVADDGPPVEEVEESAAELDEEPVAEEEDSPAEEPEKKAGRARAAKPKPERPRSTAGAWMAGTFVGGLIGAAVCLALWLFNIEPPREWRAMTAGLTGKPAVDNTTPGSGTAPLPAPMTLAEKLGMIKGGDLDRAKQAKIEEADETKSDQLAARGEYRVRSYLQQASAGKAPFKPDDPTLQAGLKDLETAAKDNADALFYLGVAREATNDLPGAQKAYAEGLERFKTDAMQKERFEAALNRRPWPPLSPCC